MESLGTRAHDILRFISSLRNTLQPANRLPPEILSCIARCLPNGCDALRIVPLTHVCRYWRRSIASTSGHWASVSNRSRSLAVASLGVPSQTPGNVNVQVFSLLDLSQRHQTVICSRSLPYPGRKE
jgi:hypothetical protein